MRFESFRKVVSQVRKGASESPRPRVNGPMMKSSNEEFLTGKTKKEVIAAEIQRIDDYTSDLLRAENTSNSKALGTAHQSQYKLQYLSTIHLVSQRKKYLCHLGI